MSEELHHHVFHVRFTSSNKVREYIASILKLMVSYYAKDVYVVYAGTVDHKVGEVIPGGKAANA